MIWLPISAFTCCAPLVFKPGQNLDENAGLLLRNVNTLPEYGYASYAIHYGIS